MRPRTSSATGTARLAATKRNFAYPASRAYPINTVGRARSALARASSPKNRGSYPTVARAVRARWGDRVSTVGPTKGTVGRPGHRKGR